MAVAMSSVETRAASWRVTVRHSGASLGETPIIAEVPTAVPIGKYVLEAPSGGKNLPANVFSDAGKTYLGTVLPNVPGDKTLSFSLSPATNTDPAIPGVELRPTSVNLDVIVGGKLLTTYVSDFANKPYFYPVLGPMGLAVTRAFPIKKDVAGEDRDHNHQRSLWFTHGKVNGLDFWASDPLNPPNSKFGSIKETSRPTVAAGPAVGVLRTTDDWLGPDGKKVCEDERVVRFYDTSQGRVFDFDIIVNATNGPVTFGDTKEGMFGFRVASSMDVKAKKGGRITNAEGINDGPAWGKASPWVDYTGPVDGKTVGIAILNHPSSFRYPTTWHVRDYGLFAANPFGWKDFGMKESGDYTIPAGQSILFRYRVILHEGETASARIPEAFKSYAEPPSVDVRPE
jgi:hypothetical protein